MDVGCARAIITGGASGLGAGTAGRLAGLGARVVLMDLPTSAGEEVAAGAGGEAMFVPADVTDAEAVAAAVETAAGAMGGIDLCVNAAGVAPAHRVVTREGAMFPLDLFRFVVDVNLIGLFDVVRNVARHMAGNEPGPDGERGVIVNVASIAAFEGQIGQAAYAASKGGVAALTLPLARDLASYGIRVNTIAPGVMDTPMLDAGPADLKERLASIQMYPKRLGTAEDFAALVVFLAENVFINGEVIRLDAATRMGPR
jgi:3-hydroxyacyl-CoA dehydrogenase/3-hydroxy-2-methylbutyryl-CoA dehydrogenase